MRRKIDRDFEHLPTLSVCIIHKNDSQSLRFCLESVLNVADEIIIIDDRSEKHHLDFIHDRFKDSRIRIVSFDGKGLDGLIRNKYLEYATKDWVLVIDSDEVLSDNGFMLKEIAKRVENDPSLPFVYDVHMVHFIYHLNSIDNSLPEHFVLRRFFKRVDGLYYQMDRKHHVLLGPFSRVGKLEDVTIYHYSHVKGLLHSVRWKYEDNIKKSQIHDPEFMNWWRRSLLNGTYPTARLHDNMDEVASLHPYPVRRLLEEDVSKEWRNYIVNE